MLLIHACKPDEKVYELRGANQKPWFEPMPFGMVYIPQGSYRMGASDEDPQAGINRIQNVSVASFWMDETEITNSEYRQYVKWVADSVAVYQTFQAGLDYYKQTDRRQNSIIEPAQIDWEKAGDIWNDDNDEVKQAIAPLYYQGRNKLKTRPEIDYRKMFFNYSYVDYQKAAQRSAQFDYKTQSYPGTLNGRSDFFVRNLKVPVYPDTLVWIRDFTYSYNEPWTLKYFYHPAFSDYPVVGITWDQANAFCQWRTNYKDQFLAESGIPSIHPYRLPTEAEWEWAARGGLLNSHYPWGGYYASNDQGCYKANFKPKRGNYVADSRYSARTVKVGTFDPNAYGLYDMAGNVAEWTSTAFDPLSGALIHDLNPEFHYRATENDSPAMKRKVIRGGSWKDVPHFLQVWARDYEYLDTSRSFIGFRCVMNALEDGQKKY